MISDALVLIVILVFCWFLSFWVFLIMKILIVTYIRKKTLQELDVFAKTQN